MLPMGIHLARYARRDMQVCVLPGEIWRYAGYSGGDLSTTLHKGFYYRPPRAWLCQALSVGEQEEIIGRITATGGIPGPWKIKATLRITEPGR